MTSDAKRVINVFVEQLSENDKIEVLAFLNDYQNSGTLQKSITETRLYSDKRTLGPVSSASCPYCGR